MSIITSVNEGWLISHEKYVNNSKKSSNSEMCQISIKNVLFNVRTPFNMDSKAKKMANQVSNNERINLTKKRKRKKNHSINKNETFIVNAAETIIKSSDYFKKTTITPQEIADNNRSARNQIDRLNNGKCLSLLCPNFTERNIKTLSYNLKIFCGNLESVMPALILNESKDVTTITVGNDIYYIMPNSSFIWGDLETIERILLKLEVKFDVVLMDPPWENKSVKRMKKYPMLSNERLSRFPVTSLTNNGGLILVWTTNNSDQNDFVRNTLFPKWGVTHLTDWHWVKVTTYGDFAVPLDSPNKCIHENLIIGRYNTEQASDEIHIQRKVFVSVPSLVHSHKPPLTEILKPYLKTDAKCLELFARYLIPGWTSCGNEVLMLQHSNYFDCL